MSLLRDFGLGQFGGSKLYEGVVAKTAASTTELLHVVLLDYDDDNDFGPVRWMPRGSTLPQQGDRCLVVLLDSGGSWVPAWWPS